MSRNLQRMAVKHLGRKKEQLQSTKGRQKGWSDNRQMNGGVHGAQRSMNGHEEKDLKLTLSEGRSEAAEGSPPGGLGRTIPRADTTKRKRTADHEQRLSPAS